MNERKSVFNADVFAIKHIVEQHNLMDLNISY